MAEAVPQEGIRRIRIIREIRIVHQESVGPARARITELGPPAPQPRIEAGPRIVRHAPMTQRASVLVSPRSMTVTTWLMPPLSMRLRSGRQRHVHHPPEELLMEPAADRITRGLRRNHSRRAVDRLAVAALQPPLLVTSFRQADVDVRVPLRDA